MEKLDLKNGDRRAVSQGEKIVNPACMHCKERLLQLTGKFFICVIVIQDDLHTLRR